MVHAVLTVAVKVWLCCMTPRALSLKFSQKLLSYMRVYTVLKLVKIYKRRFISLLSFIV